MINTTLIGIPSNAFGTEQYKFVVRTFFLSDIDMYVTEVYSLQEEKTFGKVTIPADKKEDVLAGEHFECRRYLQEVCNHRPLMYFSKGTKYEYTIPNIASTKRLGELHLKVCKEILDGEYWMGSIALP